MTAGWCFTLPIAQTRVRQSLRSRKTTPYLSMRCDPVSPLNTGTIEYHGWLIGAWSKLGDDVKAEILVLAGLRPNVVDNLHEMTTGEVRLDGLEGA